MKTFKVYLITIISCVVFTTSLAAQDLPESLEPNYTLNHFSTRIGFSTLSFLNLEYERNLDSHSNLYVMAGFKHGVYSGKLGNRNGLLCDFAEFHENRGKMGLIGGLGVTIRPSNFSGFGSESVTVYAEYRNTALNDFFRDEGCFSGSGLASASTYDFSSNELALIVSFEQSEHRPKGPRVFLSLGAGVSLMKRKYLEEGLINDQFLSNKVEKFAFPILRLDFGVKI